MPQRAFRDDTAKLDPPMWMMILLLMPILVLIAPVVIVVSLILALAIYFVTIKACVEYTWQVAKRKFRK